MILEPILGCMPRCSGWKFHFCVPGIFCAAFHLLDVFRTYYLDAKDKGM